MATIARSMRRVEDQTLPEINERIRRQTQARVDYYASHRDQIPERLAELDREWDVERMLQFNSSALSLVGLALAKKSSKWLILPIAVQGFFLQHGIQGWCPPLPLFRKAGIRTAREIEIERHALKALRGDYQALTKEDGARAFKAAATSAADEESFEGGFVAPTLTRVPQNTEAELNESIDREAELRVASLGNRPEAREARLKELQGEWDIERTIEIEAPSMSLAGLVLGATVSRKWLALPVMAQTMMLLHSLQGFYPLLPLFRRLGLRTEGEIARERYSLKALRGDFEAWTTAGPGSSAKEVWEAAERDTI
jgi:hypothetical protein